MVVLRTFDWSDSDGACALWSVILQLFEHVIYLHCFSEETNIALVETLRLWYFEIRRHKSTVSAGLWSNSTLAFISFVCIAEFRCMQLRDIAVDFDRPLRSGKSGCLPIDPTSLVTTWRMKCGRVKQMKSGNFGQPNGFALRGYHSKALHLSFLAR